MIILLILTLLSLRISSGYTMPVDVHASELKNRTFQEKILPLLESQCISCHGVEKQMGRLRLDNRSLALQGGFSGPSILEGNSSESLLIRKIEGSAEGQRMPVGGEPLTDEEVMLLRNWIDQGAHWPDIDEQAVVEKVGHWSFLPRKEVKIPDIQNREWISNEIDSIILARLENQGIQPSPQASKETLIRRLSLDLLGLLPSPAEVEVFVQDQSPDAYEKLVDRLLTSPHFGERWGRHWLDLARYADSDGYEKDNPRPYSWRYRDWVINAINRDLPFDQFTIEQLAADLLPNPSLEQITATGFNRNTLTNTEGGVDQEEFRIHAVKDRSNTVGTVWLGLTVACAECHNHKYDPISQKEYYGLFSFFNQAMENNVSAPFDDELVAYQKKKIPFDSVQNRLVDAVSAYDREELKDRMQAWLKQLKTPEEEWTVLIPQKASSFVEGVTLEAQDDGSVQIYGSNPNTNVYTLDFTNIQPSVKTLQLETLQDKNGRVGRSDGGNFVLSEIVVERVSADAVNSVTLALEEASADHSQTEYEASKAIDGDMETGWAVAPHVKEPHRLVLKLEEELKLAPEEWLRVTLHQKYGKKHTLARLRILATGADSVNLELPYDVASALRTKESERSDAQRETVENHYKTIDPIRVKLMEALEAHKQIEPRYPPSFIMALAENFDPPKSYINIRGDFLQKGDEVQPHTLSILPPMNPRGDKPDRLDLALWLVSPENPLTSRVEANRVWQNLFGVGLVETTEDFGTQGEKPSHPELLDWLANEYIRLEWSRKAIIKTIVMSSTYRQSSHTRPELNDIDPKNKLLARQNRFRLEAEILRDIALQSSGLLTEEVGGPSIRPPLPSGIAELGYANSVKWRESEGADKYKRGLYIFFQRTVPYPMLMTFDCPDSNVTAARRNRSNTPLQALTLLNSPVFFECAQALGYRFLNELEGSTLDRIREGYRICLGREPTKDEMNRLGKLFNDYYQICRMDGEKTKALLWKDPPKGISQAEAGAWVAMARTLMNLEEFMTRE